MRIALTAIFVCSALAIVVWIHTHFTETTEPLITNYVIEHFHEDTGARNSVAAILLNYRMFDTIFEALILLTAIVGMHQFLPRAVDIAGQGDATDA
jgi:multisubunit Na+/H+ antiporter MnhB subunit